MAIRKLDPNVPVNFVAKYCDIVPPNDPKFKHQLRLKGTIDGEDAMVFIPRPVWAALKAFRAAGVVEDRDYDEEPTQPLQVPLLASEFELLMEKKGSAYPELRVTTLAGANAVSRPATQTNGNRPTTAAAVAKNAGLPEGLRDDDLPPMLREQDDYEAQTIKAIQETSGNPKLARLYLGATDFVLTRVVPMYERAGIGCSDVGVAAMVATNFIAASKER